MEVNTKNSCQSTYRDSHGDKAKKQPSMDIPIRQNPENGLGRRQIKVADDQASHQCLHQKGRKKVGARRVQPKPKAAQN